MIPFGLTSLMTVSLPIARRTTKCLVPGASAIYLFNEGTGTTLRDFSGNGRDGTLGAAAAAPTWTPQGLSYDGGDYVDISALLPVLKGATEFTVHVVCSTTATAAGRGVIGSSAVDPPYGCFRIRDSTNASGDADEIRIQVTNGTTTNSVPLPGRLTATPDLLTIRFRGGEVLEARKGLSGGWTRVTTSVIAALNSAETVTDLFLGRFTTNHRTGLDAFFALYPTFLPDAQVDPNCTAIAALLAPRGVTIT
jgi:hypothetical protein